MLDYHIHSANSFDAQDSIADIAAAASDAGLSHICVTDHIEIGYPKEQADIPVEPPNIPAYKNEIALSQSQNPSLNIGFGAEVGLIKEYLEDISAFVAPCGFDFIIASQHIAGGLDPYYGTFFDKYGVRAGQKLYLEELLENIRAFNNFDVIGHIGYVDKYLPQSAGEPFTYEDFPELIDEILLSAISRGKGIEINASNLFYRGSPNPHPSIIARYAELGGEVLTVGSDSHTAGRVGAFIHEALVLAADCGLKYICTFKQRKPEFHKI